MCHRLVLLKNVASLSQSKFHALTMLGVIQPKATSRLYHIIFILRLEAELCRIAEWFEQNYHHEWFSDRIDLRNADLLYSAASGQLTWAMMGLDYIMNLRVHATHSLSKTLNTLT